MISIYVLLSFFGQKCESQLRLPKISSTTQSGDCGAGQTPPPPLFNQVPSWCYQGWGDKASFGFAFGFIKSCFYLDGFDFGFGFILFSVAGFSLGLGFVCLLPLLGFGFCINFHIC